MGDSEWDVELAPRKPASSASKQPTRDAATSSTPSSSGEVVQTPDLATAQALGPSKAKRKASSSPSPSSSSTTKPKKAKVAAQEAKIAAQKPAKRLRITGLTGTAACANADYTEQNHEINGCPCYSTDANEWTLAKYKKGHWGISGKTFRSKYKQTLAKSVEANPDPPTGTWRVNVIEKSGAADTLRMEEQQLTIVSSYS